MTESRISEEQLMAYADGELAQDKAKVVEQAVASDPRLAAQLKLFINTRAKAEETYREFLNEPVPPALLASLTAMIVDARRADEHVSHRGFVPFMSSRPALPLAAVLALFFGIAGYLAAQFTQPGAVRQRLVAIGTVEAPELAAALSNTPGGGEHGLGGDEAAPLLRVVASFRDGAGSLCREFELHSPGAPAVLAVACRGGPVWQVGFAVAAPSAEEGYAPASASEPLDAYFDAIEAGEPLTGPEEQAALITVQ